MQPATRGAFATAAAALGVTLYCLLVAWHFLAIGAAPLDVPLSYDGDALQYSYVVDAYGEGGGLGDIRSTAAPFGTQHRDFPNGDIANIAIMSVLGPHDAFGLQFNLFYLLSIALTSISAVLVARRLGLALPWACVVAVAFTLLPFHFDRLAHLFYTNYSACMLAVWLALRIGQPLASGRTRGARMLTVAAVVLASLWCGTTGVYFAFFTCLAVCTAALLWAAQMRAWRPLLRAGGVVGIIVLATALQILPTVRYTAEHGKNPQVATRSFVESEVYGTRIAQLVLPVREHRIDLLRRARHAYDALSPNVNENATATMGAFGAFGLLLALAIVLSRQTFSTIPAHVQVASGVLLVLLLFATMGGFGTLFAMGISPQMRALNRVSPLLAALALLVAASVLQGFFQRWRRPRLQAIVAMLALAAITLDQVPARGDGAIAVRERNRQRFDADRDFGQALQAALPAQAAVLQLPYVPYPETGSALGDYAQFRNNLHAPSLRWTHGAMKGRPEATWLSLLVATPAADMARVLAAAGYAAVAFDTRVQDAPSKAWPSALAQAGWHRLDASDGTQFAMVAPPSAPIARAATPDRGWHAAEGDGTQRWIWAAGDATVALAPAHGVDCVLALELNALAPTTVSARDGDRVLATASVPTSGATLRVPVPAATERFTLVGSTPAAVAGNGDPRVLGVRWRFSEAPLCVDGGPR